MLKIVITAAGRGTRLLPATKELPKEMMPIFSSIYGNEKRVIPLLQLIFEQMFSIGIRKYCFVVGREKRSIEDHFTPHESFLNEISSDEKKIISKFYKKLMKSELVWINQNKPLGFGDAVKITESYIGKDDFIVHAGDVTIIGGKNHPVLRLMEIAQKVPDASAILLCKKVSEPKRYGVPEIKERKAGYFTIKNVEEKPNNPKSIYGILPVYYFTNEIFRSLKNIKPGIKNEYQLTDAIQDLINRDKKVLAIEINKDEEEIDVGNVFSYKKSLDSSFLKA